MNEPIRDLDFHRLADTEDRRRRRQASAKAIGLLLNILIFIFTLLNAYMLWNYLCH